MWNERYLPDYVIYRLKNMSFHTAAIKTVEGTKWGYIDNNGKFVISPKFDYALDFQGNNLAVIQLMNHFGIIDKLGQYVVKPKYEDITEFSEGRAVVNTKNGFKVIDETGKELTSISYNFIGSYKEGRALFAADKSGKYLYGYLNRQGKEAIPAQYESAGDFKQGKAIVKIADNMFALIDIYGKVLNRYNYASVINRGSGLLAFQETSDGKYGYIDETGKVIINPRYSSAEAFIGDRAVVGVTEDYVFNYGLIDKKGNFLIKPMYNMINLIGEERVSVGRALDKEKPYLSYKYALADINGNFITDFVYNSISEYENGAASVSNDKSTFFIDKRGNMIKDLPIVAGDGTLSFEGEIIKANVNMRIFYLNKAGKVIWAQNRVIPLNNQVRVVEEKYMPNKDYLVYYPQLQGMSSRLAEQAVNKKLRALSQLKPIESNTKLDYSYNGDFSVELFKKRLLVLELNGYQYYFGAAHGMPTKVYSHINIDNGSFYELKDLFKPGSDYVKVLSDIIGNMIKDDEQYSYVFPDTYKGISANQPFYIGKETLNIYFAPYEIAPYAAGFPTFKIPYIKIMNIINQKGDFWRAFNY